MIDQRRRLSFLEALDFVETYPDVAVQRLIGLANEVRARTGLSPIKHAEELVRLMDLVTAEYVSATGQPPKDPTPEAAWPSLFALLISEITTLTGLIPTLDPDPERLGGLH